MLKRLIVTLIISILTFGTIDAEQFRILRLNTPEITIDSRVYQAGDTIDLPNTIDWTSDAQAVQLIGLSTGKLFFLSAKENKGQRNLWKRMYSEEKGSTRQVKIDRAGGPDLEFGSVLVHLRDAALAGDTLTLNFVLISDTTLVLSASRADPTQACIIDSGSRTYPLSRVHLRSDRFASGTLTLPKAEAVECSIIVVGFNPSAKTIVNMSLPFELDGEYMPLIMRRIPTDYIAPASDDYLRAGSTVRRQ